MTNHNKHTNIVETVQDYICKNVQLHPLLYFQYLTELYQQMRQERLSLTPLGLLEYYNLKINLQMKTNTDKRKERITKRKTSKVA